MFFYPTVNIEIASFFKNSNLHDFLNSYLYSESNKTGKYVSYISIRSPKIYRGCLKKSNLLYTITRYFRTKVRISWHLVSSRRVFHTM